MTIVLAIDQGTSGTKAVVVDADGTVLGLAEQAVRPSYSAGGAVEQDPEALLESVLAAGREAVALTRAPIDVVSLANQGESVLAWDRATGRALSPIIVWQDRRAESVTRRLGVEADEIARRTGLVLDPYFSAPKQQWVRENLTRDGVITTTDSWLIHRLTGEFVTDASTAGRSLVVDLDTGGWDRELLSLFGLGDEELPEIVPCDRVVGSTSAFGGRLPVGGLIVDQPAALLAQGCLDAGQAKCTFGTGAFLLANIGATPTRSTTGLATSIAWQQGEQLTYCLDGQVYAAASAVRWLQDLGLLSSAADLDRVCSSVEDNGGVLAVPALAGLAAPWWEPNATASLHGMTLSTTAGHIVLAVLQGIAAQVAELGELIAADSALPRQRLRVDGGLTRSSTLMGAVADLMQVEVDVYPSQHATPLGAAAFGRLAVDPQLTLAEAVIPWQPSATYEPRWTAGQALEFRDAWRGAAGKGRK
jgi:glycerol kinase